MQPTIDSQTNPKDPWLQALLTGITRCDTEAMLKMYWLRWSEEIRLHPDSEKIVDRFKARKGEIGK